MQAFDGPQHALGEPALGAANLACPERFVRVNNNVLCFRENSPLQRGDFYCALNNDHTQIPQRRSIYSPIADAGPMYFIGRDSVAMRLQGCKAVAGQMT